MSVAVGGLEAWVAKFADGCVTENILLNLFWGILSNHDIHEQ